MEKLRNPKLTEMIFKGDRCLKVDLNKIFQEITNNNINNKFINPNNNNINNLNTPSNRMIN